MFTEELAGNASRKRAEENRARRRRLKQQQEKQQRTATAKDTAPFGTDPAVGAASMSTAISQPSAQSLSVTAPVAIGVQVLAAPNKLAAATTQLSAVERAEKQRFLRAKANAQQKASVVIQSVYRAYRSNQMLRNHHRDSLSKKLSDILSLRTILAIKSVSDYVPPPATTTVLVQQLLLISGTVRYRERPPRLDPAIHCDLIAQLLELCLVSGLKSTDDNLHPLLSWIESKQSLMRLEALLRLLLLYLLSKSASSQGTTAAIDALRLLITFPEDATKSQARKNLVLHCRSLLIRPISETIPSPEAEGYVLLCQVGSTLDIVSITRFYLMFLVSGGPSPIPANSVDLREKCIPEVNKIRAGSLLRLVLDAIENASSTAERDILRARLVTDILTVPLLSWKVCWPTISYLVERSQVTRKMPVVRMLEALIEVHSEVLSSGQVEELLAHHDVALTLCPATSSQCLLANLVVLIQSAPSINTSDPSLLDRHAVTLVFHVLATLVDAVILGTFSSRDSSVEWITDGKGQHTPIVLSPIILEQCKLIMLDSFVRRLFNLAIDLDALNIDNALASKNDKDKKHEKDLSDEGVLSATSLAAKEARIDRNRSFWNSGSWARKLTKGVSNLLDGAKKAGSTTGAETQGQGKLMNTTSMSRKLAEGNRLDADSAMTEALPSNSQSALSTMSSSTFSSDMLFALCRTYTIILARWGGDGNDDIVRLASPLVNGKDLKVATPKPQASTLALLNVLCFSTPIVRASWGIIQSDHDIISETYAIIDERKGTKLIRNLDVRPDFARQRKSSVSRQGNGAALLYMFVSTLAHILIVTDDIEIHDMDRPLPVHQLRRCIQVLKKLLHRACCLDSVSTQIRSNYFGIALITSSSRAMRDLYDRSSRHPLCVPKLWLVSGLLEEEMRRCKTNSDYVQLLSLPVLRVSPFLVSFKRRLKLFERIVTTNRFAIQGVNDGNPFNSNPLKPGLPVRIARGRLLEDGLATMNNLGSNMRQRIAVHYVNEAGTEETGIDAGGLFKEFWTDLCAIAFDPNYALFQVTDGAAGNCLYPNPSASAAHGSDAIVLFEFLGRILGKALYEGITIGPRFAHFFLSFLRGDYNYLHMLPDLSTVDPQLYNNLMFLKTYDGDAQDLCLSFTVTVDDFGGTTELSLVPNGSKIDVTNGNKQRYIGLVAKHYVVDRVKDQSEAFTRGLWEVIDRSWLRIFNEPELQVLISGASEKIDVDDWRSNSRYAGGYTGIDRNIHRFWSVVASLDGKQQAELLRFVTSCERPPPLGFASMNPPFTIQRVGIMRDGDMLPSASTCFNTLKLPTYSSEKVLKQRLVYAIQSGAGFELT